VAALLLRVRLSHRGGDRRLAAGRSVGGPDADRTLVDRLLHPLPRLVAEGPGAILGGGSVTSMARLSGVYKHLRLLGVLFKISFQDDAAYRGEFWIRLLSMFYSLGTVAVGLWILFSNTERIAG